LFTSWVVLLLTCGTLFGRDAGFDVRRRLASHFFLGTEAHHGVTVKTP
jgi:hypothetical protein